MRVKRAGRQQRGAAVVGIWVVLLGGGVTADAERTAPAARRVHRRAFVNVQVVTMEEPQATGRRTVLVEGDRIVVMAPPDSLTLAADVERIDGANGFLMPGLVDLHAHYTRAEDLDLYVANGVLTVQFLNADADILALRDRQPGPCPSIDACMGPVSGVTDSLAAETILDQAAQAGFDCIKIYDDCTVEAYRVLAHSAARRHMRAVGHIPRNLTWQTALAVRPTAIAHAEEFLYSPIRTAGEQDTLVQGLHAGNIAVISTLVNYDAIGRQPVELQEMLQRPELGFYSPVHRRAWGPTLNHYVRDFPAARVPNLRRLLVFQRRLLQQLDAAGGLVLVGTDAGNLFVLPGWSVHEELEELVLGGMTTYAALGAATRAAAAFLGRTDRGTVAVGQRAELVLLHGNPLQDIRNTQLIAGVMTGGEWLPRAELRRRLEALRKGFAAEERMMEILETRGLDAALRFVDTERRRLGRPPVGVVALNELAYQYWKLEEKLPEARRAFEANARLYPKDPIAQGSLAEFRAATNDAVKVGRPAP